MGREEEFEHGDYAAGPAGFVVGSAMDALEVEGLAGEPSVGFEAAIELFGVFEGAVAFAVAYVEPDAGALPDLGGAFVEVAEDALVVPPDAGGEQGEAAEALGVAEAEEERDQAAERGAAEAGGFAVGEDAVLGGDPGHELAGEHEAVLVGLAAAHLPVALVGVLGESAVAGVVDADDDEGLDLAGLDGGVSLLADLPGAAGDEGGAAVKEVLAVVEIEDGVEAVGLLLVAGRQVDDEVAVFRQVVAGESAMKAETRVGGVSAGRGLSGSLGGLGFKA